MVCGLPLQKLVAGPAPELYLIAEVIQDKIAFRGADGKHGVSLSIGLPYNRDQQVRQRNAGRMESLPLFQNIVFTVADAIGRICPELFFSVDVAVVHGTDFAIYGEIDVLDRGAPIITHDDRTTITRSYGAFEGACFAELVVTDRLRGETPGRHVAVCNSHTAEQSSPQKAHHVCGAAHHPPSSHCCTPFSFLN